ncbi:hypothetical protein QRE66_06175 [Bacillus cereus]|nr:hypothetical protein QRE66_06175 [Bacillus cereus]
MNNFFKCPPAFPPNFPTQGPAGFGFASVNGPPPGQSLSISNNFTTVSLPKPGPLNNVLSTGQGLTILEPGVYELGYMVTVSFSQNFNISDEQILTLNFLGRLFSTPSSGAPGTLVDGSQSRITDIFEVEGGSNTRYADTLGSPVLIEVSEPTTISIEVQNQTTVTGGIGNLINPGRVEFATLFVEQIA